MEFWSKEEERQLIQMHHRGANIYMIANVLKRTPTAIENLPKENTGAADLQEQEKQVVIHTI